MFWTTSTRDSGNSKLKVYFDKEDLDFKPWCIDIKNDGNNVKVFLDQTEMESLMAMVVEKMPSPALEEAFQIVNTELVERDKIDINGVRL